MRDFLLGLSYNAVGFRYFLKNKTLWKYAFIPLILNILGVIFCVSLYLWYFNDIFAFLSKPLGGIDIVDASGFWWSTLDALLWFVRNLFKIFIFTLSLLFVFVFVYLIATIVNSPFYEMMAEKILILQGVRTDQPFQVKRFLSETAHSLKIQTAKLLLFTAVTVALTIFSWIPLIGILFSLVQFFFTAWLFAFSICTFPFVIDKKPFSQILQWAWRHKLSFTGFGLPSLIPFLGLLLMSFQVTGGTLLCLEKQQQKVL
jgi:uncharacterized protein involved in cysteine biosynthesis